MDGQDGFRAGGREADIDRRQGPLPVVRMQHGGRERRHGAAADIGGRAAQRGEAAPVVGPVLPVRAEIGIAGAVEEVGRVEDDEVETGRLPGDERRGAAEVVVIAEHRLATGECRHHFRVAGDERAQLDAVLFQRGGHGADHVGEAAGLHQREDLGGDAEDRNHGRFSLSIIGWVIRQTPFSVRRKRSASLSTSSPTTMPSGMRTPRSTTTRLRRAPRPTCT